MAYLLLIKIARGEYNAQKLPEICVQKPKAA